MRGGTTRASRSGKPQKSVVATLLLTAIVGVFVVLAAPALWELAARIAPVHVETVTVVDRKRVIGAGARRTSSPFYGAQARANYRLTLAPVDGGVFDVDVPRELYELAHPRRMESRSVNVQRSVLFGKPRVIEIFEAADPDATDTPAGQQPAIEREDALSPVAVYDVSMPLVLIAGAFALLAIAVWAVIRMPRRQLIMGRLAGGGMVLSFALGTWWWAAWV